MVDDDSSVGSNTELYQTWSAVQSEEDERDDSEYRHRRLSLEKLKNNRRISGRMMSIEEDTAKANDATTKYLAYCGTCGLIDTLENMNDNAKYIGRLHGWRHWKLVGESDYKNYQSDFVRSMIAAAGYTGDKSELGESWWDSVRNVVKQSITDRRKNVTQAMKKQFHGMFATLFDLISMGFLWIHLTPVSPCCSPCCCDEELYEAKKLPALEELEKLREGSAFEVFVDSFVSSVVGREKFKRNRVVKLVSTFVDCSDEAFALLVLANNYNVWTEWMDLTIDERKTAKLKEKPKFFGTKSQYNDAGKTYYEAMLVKVHSQRKQSNTLVLETKYMSAVQAAQKHVPAAVSMKQQNKTEEHAFKVRKRSERDERTTYVVGSLTAAERLPFRLKRHRSMEGRRLL